MPDILRALLDKGVTIPSPHAVEIADDIDPSRISGDGVVLHAGCQLRGARTVLSAGARLGTEGPVVLENCQLGPDVTLAGGYASNAVFLAGASMGLGHHVREGTLLEEEASGAHTVGLKQTILFPFVTLGSLINFCDAFMAGGTSRSDHSEVGSSYIHFNFTPNGDKARASMFGDVPRGVMLREKRIFLGGQGGTVGPVSVAYGTVVGAGSILRSDVIREDSLVIVGPPPSVNEPYTLDEFRGAGRLVAVNVDYLASLDALEQWYRHIRAPFFARQELGDLVLEGALAVLASARKERVSRLVKVAAMFPGNDEGQRVMTARMPQVGAVFGTVETPAPMPLIKAMTAAADAGVGYLDAVRALEPDDVAAGTAWLRTVIDAQWAKVSALLPTVRRVRRL